MEQKMKIFSLTLLILFIFIFLAVVWVNADGYEIQVEIPGGLTKGTKVENIGDYIRGIFKFGLIAIGLVAFGAIVVGAIQYTVSAGNESQTKEGKDRILHGIYGVVLLLLSFLILNTINPDIVSLREPMAPTTTVSAIETMLPVFLPSSTIKIDGATITTCVSADVRCDFFKDGCLELMKTHVKSTICGGPENCQAQGLMITYLCQLANYTDWIAYKDWDWRVTEAFPPTQEHKDPGHYNGCAVDIAFYPPLKNPPTAEECERVERYETLLKDTFHFKTVLNEYKQCGGTTTEYQTGGHFHLNVCN